MRVTHNSQMKNYLSRMNRTLKDFNSSNNKLSSQREINKASDNVLDATRALRVRKELDDIQIYQDNIRDAQARASTAEDNVKFLTSTLRTTKERLVQGINGTYSAEDRDKIAQEIANLQEETLQVMNSQYGGKYIFASEGGPNSANEQPFVVGEDGKIKYHGYNVDTMQKHNEKVMVPDTAGPSWVLECDENGDPKKYIINIPQYNNDAVMCRDGNGDVIYESQTVDQYDSDGNLLGPITLNLPKYTNVAPGYPHFAVPPTDPLVLEEVTNHVFGYGKDTAWLPEIGEDGKYVSNTVKNPFYYKLDPVTGEPIELTCPDDLELVYNEDGNVQYQEVKDVWLYEWNDKASLVKKEAEDGVNYSYPYFVKPDPTDPDKKYVYELLGNEPVKSEDFDLTGQEEYYYIDANGTPVTFRGNNIPPNAQGVQCYKYVGETAVTETKGAWQQKQKTEEDTGRLIYKNQTTGQTSYLDLSTQRAIYDATNQTYDIYNLTDLDASGVPLPTASVVAQGVKPVYDSTTMSFPVYKDKTTGKILNPKDYMPKPDFTAGSADEKIYNMSEPKDTINYIPYKKLPYEGENYLDTGFGIKTTGWGADGKIDKQSVYRYSYSGLELFGFGTNPETGMPNNIYSLLGSAKSALETDTVGAMNDCLASVTKSLDTILIGLTDIGEKYNYLDQTNARLTSEEENYQEVQTALEAVDVAEEAMYNKSHEMAWMVTLQLGSKVLPTSIWDFLR